MLYKKKGYDNINICVKVKAYMLQGYVNCPDMFESRKRISLNLDKGNMETIRFYG